MAQNKLSDLNNHLFAQLERLGDEDLTPEQLKLEVTRSKSISGIAKNVIENAKITLDAMQFSVENLPADKQLPEVFKLTE